MGLPSAWISFTHGFLSPALRQDGLSWNPRFVLSPPCLRAQTLCQGTSSPPHWKKEPQISQGAADPGGTQKPGIEAGYAATPLLFHAQGAEIY